MCAIFLRAISFCLLLYVGLTSAPVHAFEESYLPLDSKILSRRLKQQLVCDPLESGKSTAYKKTKISISETGFLQAHGTDNSGHPWSLVAGAWQGCASIWSADLDRNGVDDLIIAMHTRASGSEPSAQLVTLMFEKNGRPMPWAIEGYFEIDDHGIKDLLDCDHGGRAELISQNQSDGYWITSIYAASNARWHQLSKFSGASAPMYTRYTENSNRTTCSPPAHRHPYAADLSNAASTAIRNQAVYIDALEWPLKTTFPSFKLSDGRKIRPKYCSSTMCAVLDEPSGRRAALITAPNAVRKLLTEITSRSIPVTTSGAKDTQKKQVLSSELIFARASANDLTNNRSTYSPNLDLALNRDINLP